MKHNATTDDIDTYIDKWTDAITTATNSLKMWVNCLILMTSLTWSQRWFRSSSAGISSVARLPTE